MALIIIPYVSRVLSVERLGGVSFAQSVSTWASALCLLGVNVYGVRECARVRDDARELALVVKELLVIIAAATSVVVIGFAAAIFVVPSFASVAPLMWMFLVETPVLPCGIECFYRGGERCACITVSSLAFKMLAFAGAVTPVRIVGAVSLMSCVSCFVAMGILSPLGRERRMAMPSIAAAPVCVVLNLLLDGPFGEVGAGVALLAAEATVLRIELWCARDALPSFMRPRDLARMAASNAVAVAVSAGCAWLLATAFSAGPEVIAIAGLLVCSAVDIVAAVALRDDTALMLVGKARAALRRG